MRVWYQTHGTSHFPISIRSLSSLDLPSHLLGGCCRGFCMIGLCTLLYPVIYNIFRFCLFHTQLLNIRPAVRSLRHNPIDFTPYNRYTRFIHLVNASAASSTPNRIGVLRAEVKPIMATPIHASLSLSRSLSVKGSRGRAIRISTSTSPQDFFSRPWTAKPSGMWDYFTYSIAIALPARGCTVVESTAVSARYGPCM